jgi:hypothetical protein
MADWAEVYEELVQAKDINLPYNVTNDGSPHDLSGKALRMLVVDNTGTTVKTWLSTGVSPAITIATSMINIADTTGFTDWGFYEGELINDTDDETLAFFEFNIKKQITPPTV